MNAVQNILQKLTQLNNTSVGTSSIEEQLTLTQSLYELLLEKKIRQKIASERVQNAADTPFRKEIKINEDAEEVAEEPVMPPDFNLKPQPIHKEGLSLELPLSFHIKPNTHVNDQEKTLEPKGKIQEPPLKPVEEVVTEPEVKSEELKIEDLTQQLYQSKGKTENDHGKIEKRIGLNDYILFVNDLFENSKADYQHSLDVINEMSNYEEAKQWINQNPAKTYQWNPEDETVQSFYELVEKYFSFK